jgi:hypothetical protein
MIEDQFDMLYREAPGWAGHMPVAPSAQYRPAECGQASRRGAALNPRHDRVWATSADDIAKYYLANYYGQIKFWITAHKAQPRN